MVFGVFDHFLNMLSVVFALSINDSPTPGAVKYFGCARQNLNPFLTNGTFVIAVVHFVLNTIEPF